jgi:nicotine blue oxidoreductase
MGNAEAQVAGVLLAAGGGRRMGGRAKALLEYRGRLLVEHAAGVLRAGGCAPVHVVLGAARQEVTARADLRGCTVVECAEWASGMGASLRAGLASLAGTGCAAAVIGLVDTPGVTPEAVARVIAAHRAGAGLAAAVYGGRRGHPVLIGAGHWPGVAEAASGDTGARAYLAAHAAELRLVECGDVASDEDLDTPEQWSRHQGRGSGVQQFVDNPPRGN